MNKKKTIIAALVLLLLLVIGGAVAYFTDKEEETNVFTFGSVDIELEEANWNADNAKLLLPGDSVNKDPVVTNVGKSPAYVFLKVEEPCYDGATIFDYSDSLNTEWSLVADKSTTCAGGATTAVAYYSYGANNALRPLAIQVSTPPLFKEVMLKESLTSEALETLNDGTNYTANVVVTAYGVQTANVTPDRVAIIELFPSS